MSSATAARPKRSAETFTRTHQDGQPSKKPRFDVRNPSALAPDELEDDAILEADVIGTRGQQVRRSAVNIDGYDSDSDNENFDARAAARAKAEKQAKSKDEEQDDMFADLEEDVKDADDDDDEDGVGGGVTGKKHKKNKAVRFLNSDEIEGQVNSSKSGGHVSADFNLNGSGKQTQTEDVESSSDSDVSDAARANADTVDDELGAGHKKTHAPKLDAFNMHAEQDEGRFDDQGNFVRKAADPDAIHDQWLSGISKKDMKAASSAAAKREEERRKRNLEDDSKSQTDVLQTLIPLLERGETILEALARLGKARGTTRDKKKKPKWQTKQKNKKQTAVEDDAEMADEDAQEVRRRERVEAITAAADLLLTRGQAEIYDAERELLIRQYNREADKPWVDPPEKDESEDKMWEYKWTDARDGGNINGPYDSPTMRSWIDAGYFGDGVVFRHAGDTSDTSWSPVLPL